MCQNLIMEMKLYDNTIPLIIRRFFIFYLQGNFIQSFMKFTVHNLFRTIVIQTLSVNSIFGNTPRYGISKKHKWLIYFEEWGQSLLNQPVIDSNDADWIISSIPRLLDSLCRQFSWWILSLTIAVMIFWMA